MDEVSNSVIVERIQGIKDLIESRFDSNAEEHKRIEAQVLKTNGRVSAGEDWQAKYENTLDELVEERKEKKSNINGISWEVIKMCIIGIVVVSGNAIWLNYFAK